MISLFDPGVGHVHPLRFLNTFGMQRRGEVVDGEATRG